MYRIFDLLDPGDSENEPVESRIEPSQGNDSFSKFGIRRDSFARTMVIGGPISRAAQLPGENVMGESCFARFQGLPCVCEYHLGRRKVRGRRGPKEIQVSHKGNLIRGERKEHHRQQGVQIAFATGDYPLIEELSKRHAWSDEAPFEEVPQAIDREGIGIVFCDAHLLQLSGGAGLKMPSLWELAPENRRNVVPIK